MSTLLFAILDASHARRGLIVYERALDKAQAAYDQCAVTSQKRASSRNPEVRQRAKDALLKALDTLDECRAKLESEQARSTALDLAEQEASKNALVLMNQESAELQQHRNCHA